MDSKSQQKQHKVKFSSRADIGIGTGWDQWNRKKTSTKTSSTGKVKDRREANTPINWINGCKMSMVHEASPHLWIIPGKKMTVIKILVFIRARGAIKPHFKSIFLSHFLEQYPIFTLPRQGSSFFMAWQGLGSSEGRRRINGESEGVVKVLTEFLE